MFYFIVFRLWSACQCSVVTNLKRYEYKVRKGVSLLHNVAYEIPSDLLCIL